jgi:hypothetical protein
MNIGVLGSGVVGQTLADGFLKHGHDVMRGSREPAKLDDWKKGAGAHGSTGTFAETAKFGEVLVLAVKGDAAEKVVDACGLDNLAGKPILDTTNPIGGAAVNGVLPYFTGPNDSLMERLQAKAPKAHFVKAFNSVGSPKMVNPDYGGQRPTMFVCGNDAKAKATTKGILETFGWDVADMGVAAAARAIEPLCMLWCISGFLNNEWTHAFKVLHAK